MFVLSLEPHRSPFSTQEVFMTVLLLLLTDFGGPASLNKPEVGFSPAARYYHGHDTSIW